MYPSLFIVFAAAFACTGGVSALGCNLWIGSEIGAVTFHLYAPGVEVTYIDTSSGKEQEQLSPFDEIQVYGDTYFEMPAGTLAVADSAFCQDPDNPYIPPEIDPHPNAQNPTSPPGGTGGYVFDMNSPSAVYKEYRCDPSIDQVTTEGGVTERLLFQCGAPQCHITTPEAMGTSASGLEVLLASDTTSYYVTYAPSCPFRTELHPPSLAFDTTGPYTCIPPAANSYPRTKSYGALVNGSSVDIHDVYKCYYKTRCVIHNTPQMSTSITFSEGYTQTAMNTFYRDFYIYSESPNPTLVTFGCNAPIYYLGDPATQVRVLPDTQHPYKCSNEGIFCDYNITSSTVTCPTRLPPPVCYLSESCDTYLTDDITGQQVFITGLLPDVTTGRCTCPPGMSYRYQESVCTCGNGFRYSAQAQACVNTCDYYIFDPETQYSTPIMSDGMIDYKNRCMCNKDGMRRGPPDFVQFDIKTTPSVRSPTAVECRCNAQYTRLDPTTNTCVPHTCKLKVYGQTGKVVVNEGGNTLITYTNQAVVDLHMDTSDDLVYTYLSGYCSEPQEQYINWNIAVVCNNPGDKVFMPRTCIKGCPLYQTYQPETASCQCDANTKPELCHTCGPWDSCNTHGVCVAINASKSFCSCRDGYTGEYCQDPPARTCITTSNGAWQHCELNYENWQCNCGMKWSDAMSSINLEMQAISWRSTQEQEEMDAKIFSLPGGPVIRVNVPYHSIEAAKFDCAMYDPYCKGIVIVQQNGVFKATPITTKPLTSQSQIPSWLSGLSYNVFMIDRTGNYDCPGGDQLNPEWYYWDSPYRKDIESKFMGGTGLCPYDNTCAPGVNLPKPGPFSINANDNWYLWAIEHWRQFGHLKRYSPNSACKLSPMLWDPATNCALATPGCEQVNPTPGQDTIPCSSPHGYCVRSDSTLDKTAYKCDCKKFTEQEVLGGDLQTLPRYMGLACQFESLQKCQYTNTSSTDTALNLCFSQPERCVPRATNIVTSSLVSSKIDYYPSCECKAFTNPFTGASYGPSAFTGEFCHESRCGENSFGCKRIDASSECVVTTSSSEYKCQCGADSAGVFCEASAAPCKSTYQDHPFKCSDAGTCLTPSQSTNLEGTPNYSTQHPWCKCDEGHSGEWCHITKCSNSTLEPGNGICDTDGKITRCYPVFTGSRCATRLCELSGGNTTDKSTCSCPFNLGLTIKTTSIIQYGDTNITDPTCWRRCPGIGTTVCGDSSVNKCEQVSTGTLASQRTATCLCSSVNGWRPVTISDPVLGSVVTCEKKCVNGVPGTICNSAGQSCLASVSEPCVCEAGWKGDRCDTPTCINGKWDNNTGQCSCSPLYNGPTCNQNTCDNPVTTDIIEGTVSNGQCICNNPYTPSNPNTRVDCNGSICGPYGKRVLNPLTYKGQCACDVAYETVCRNEATDCSFCSLSYCRNGGTAPDKTKALCDCSFPFKSRVSGTRCSYTECSVATRDPATGLCLSAHMCTDNGIPVPGYCICKNGWTSWTNSTDHVTGVCVRPPCCSVSPCQNGGVWHQARLACVCDTEKLFTGPYCDYPLIRETTPEVSKLDCGVHGNLTSAGDACICRNYYSGSTCNISPCQVPGSTFNNTKLACNCPPNFAGTFCDVYIQPPPVQQSSSTGVGPPTLKPSSSPNTHHVVWTLLAIAVVVVCISS